MYDQWRRLVASQPHLTSPLEGGRDELGPFLDPVSCEVFNDLEGGGRNWGIPWSGEKDELGEEGMADAISVSGG